MRSFVVREKEALRRVAVVCTMNSGGASNAVGEIAHLLPHGIVIDAATFKAREIEDGSGTARLIAFGDGLQPGSTSSQPVHRPAWTSPAA